MPNLRFDKKQKYITIDCETEGLNLIKSRPWQVSWVLCQGGEVIEKFDKFLFWDNLDVSPDAARITGFNQKVYESKAQDPKEVWKEFSKFLYDENIKIIGQNFLGFDVYMINIWCKLIGIGSDYSFIDRVIDTRAIEMAISKEAPVDYENFIYWQYRWLNHRDRKVKTSQAYMLKKYEIDHDPDMLHNSLYDVEMTYKIFMKQIWKIEL